MDYLEMAQLARHVDFARFEEWRRSESRRLVLLSTRAALPYTQFDFADGDILLLGREFGRRPGSGPRRRRRPARHSNERRRPQPQRRACRGDGGRRSAAPARLGRGICERELQTPETATRCNGSARGPGHSSGMVIVPSEIAKASNYKFKLTLDQAKSGVSTFRLSRASMRPVCARIASKHQPRSQPCDCDRFVSPFSRNREPTGVPAAPSDSQLTDGGFKTATISKQAFQKGETRAASPYETRHTSEIFPAGQVGADCRRRRHDGGLARDR